jgi:cytochrome c biogenesis protein CcmG/thiol:disulfide interchange protein DsbE
LAVAALAASGLLLVFAAALGGAHAELEPGAPAPNFVLETFAGDTVALSDLRGQVVVLNFWASWCKECEVEAEELQALADSYAGRGVTVLGVDYTDTKLAALAYLERFGVTYPNGPDAGGQISRAYRITGVPETIVIDPGGRIVPLTIRGLDAPSARVKGPLTASAGFTARDLDSLVAALLPETP